MNNIINIPVIGVVGALLKEWMPLLDEYYYCESLNPTVLCSCATHRRHCRFCPLIIYASPCSVPLVRFSFIEYDNSIFQVCPCEPILRGNKSVAHDIVSHRCRTLEPKVCDRQHTSTTTELARQIARALMFSRTPRVRRASCITLP